MEKGVIAPLSAFGDGVGFVFTALEGGETLRFGDAQPLLAASLIKLPVLAEVFFRIENGALSKNAEFTVRPEDKLPSCGALNYMHSGLSVTLEDLYTLMIILSDNTAANMLIKLLGMDAVNDRMEALGLCETRLNRLLFDSEASARGLENYTSARDMARLLELMYRGELVSRAASADMLRILSDQRLNGKLPLSLPRGTKIAHKTGEDSGVTHDVGIVYAKRPYIICAMANRVDAPAFERALHGVARDIFDIQNA